MIQTQHQILLRPHQHQQDDELDSTDCTLNNSDIMRTKSNNSLLTTAQDSHDVNVSNHQKNGQKPTSPCCVSPCCGTATETFLSSPSNWSQDVGGVLAVPNDSKRQLSDFISNCLVCFWPNLYMHNIGDEQQRPHNDCFVAVSTSRLIEPEHYWRASSYADTTMIPTDISDNNNTLQCIESVQPGETDDVVPRLRTTSLPLLPLHNQLRPIHVEDANTLQVINRPRRLTTPITVQSQNNGHTLTSTLNTLHRRTDDITLDFFTTNTLDEIHGGTTGTPRNDQEPDQRKENNNNNNHLSAFQTPGGNRVRIDSDSFRKTIKVVTCEKRKISDDSDISPIDSDAGFSPMIDYGHKRVDAVESLEQFTGMGQQSPVHSSQKRLLFDVGSVRRYDTPNNVVGPGGRSLFQDSTPEGSTSQQHLSPLSEFGMSVMKSLQSIIQGRSPTSNMPPYVDTPDWGYANNKENMSRNTPTTLVNDGEQQLWQDSFLQKSSSFLKALRRSGRRGKVLISGWAAFRENVPWKDIIRNPKRCDFRYIILLDDMPLLHIFSSRPKQKKMMPKHDVLQDCITFDLTEEDLSVKINLVSKELGNEVCIFNLETKERYYSLLPIPMPDSVFLDKHKSRLAKGDALESIFEPFRRYVSFEDGPSSLSSCSNDLMMVDKSLGMNDLRATVEQYDVSRHLLFVIDSVIFLAQTRA